MQGMTWFPLLTNDSPETAYILNDILPEMACKLSADCDLTFGILSCNFLEDTIDVDLKIYTLQGIHTFKKDWNTQVIKCSPWGMDVKLFPSLQKKMVEFLRCGQIIATSFANRSYQPRPKATAGRRCNLVTLTRQNREKLSQPRKVNVGHFPPAIGRNWLAMLKAKEVIGITSSQAPHLASQCIHQSHSPLLHPYLLNIPSTVQSAPHCRKYVLTNMLCLQTGTKISRKDWRRSKGQ